MYKDAMCGVLVIFLLFSYYTSCMDSDFACLLNEKSPSETLKEYDYAELEIDDDPWGDDNGELHDDIINIIDRKLDKLSNNGQSSLTLLASIERSKNKFNEENGFMTFNKDVEIYNPHAIITPKLLHDFRFPIKVQQEEQEASVVLEESLNENNINKEQKSSHVQIENDGIPKKRTLPYRKVRAYSKRRKIICDECEKECKNAIGLKVHQAKMHRKIK